MRVQSFGTELIINHRVLSDPYSLQQVHEKSSDIDMFGMLLALRNEFFLRKESFRSVFQIILDYGLPVSLGSSNIRQRRVAQIDGCNRR